MKLTTQRVGAAGPRDKAYKLADLAGLYPHISSAGGSSWRRNYRADRRQGTKIYGECPELSLAQARTAHSTAHGIFRAQGLQNVA